MVLLQNLAWVACVIYSTIPTFWLMIHPRASRWRSRKTSPYKILLPLWMGMWTVTTLATAPWRGVALYENRWTWIPAAALVSGGIILYKLSGHRFTLSQLAGLAEITQNHGEQRLVTGGIRSYVRHPIYLGHLCEMLAWSLGSGLAVCWTLTLFAIATAAWMIRTEDRELEERFGEEFRQYRNAVPTIFPNKLFW